MMLQKRCGAAIEVHKLLTRILHERFGIYGQAGKAGWTIARGQICREQI